MTAARCFFVSFLISVGMAVIAQADTLQAVNDDFIAALQRPNMVDPQILKAKASHRKDLLLALLPDHPKDFLQYALPESATQKVPNFLEGLTEKYVHLQGVLAILVKDNFNDPKPERNYYLIGADKNSYQLYFSETPMVRAGSMVQVKGVLLGRQVAVTDLSSQSLIFPLIK